MHRKFRLLVVDDHKDTARAVARLLVRNGHTVTVAGCVRDALDLCAVDRFDAALLDIGLPDGTGIELMQTLKARYGLPGVALSGYGHEHDIRRGLDAGFHAYLVKPADVEAILRAIRSAVPRTPDDRAGVEGAS